jgi:hypothetical protein
MSGDLRLRLDRLERRARLTRRRTPSISVREVLLRDDPVRLAEFLSAGVRTGSIAVCGAGPVFAADGPPFDEMVSVMNQLPTPVRMALVEAFF